MIRRIGLFAFLFALLCGACALAQNASTSLRGVVKDPSGAVVPGATVIIANKQLGTQTMATSNAQGEYSFQQVTPGTYTITVTASGFGTLSRTAQLLVAQPATVNVQISVQADTTSVDVSATAFAWEAFNVTNSERFDVHSLDTGSTDGSQLGVYSGGLTQSRRMQFSGRFEF